MNVVNAILALICLRAALKCFKDAINIYRKKESDANAEKN